MSHEVEIPSTFTLEEISEAIMLEESIGFRFKDNGVDRSVSPFINKATFKHYEGAGFPPDCLVLSKGANTPKDHHREWSGEMLVQGTPRQVSLFRLNVESSSTLDVLKRGLHGSDTEHWQHFLVGQGYGIEVTKVFDESTAQATTRFQKDQGLDPDGVVGNRTYSRAALLGFEIVNFASVSGSGYPARPDFRPLETTAERQKIFGTFQYEPSPTADNRERILIKGAWPSQNLVDVVVPQLRGVSGAPASGKVRVHRLCADPITALFQAWEQAGLIDHVLTWDGAFVPRFVRGSRKTLSNHAFGTAFDINAKYNRLGAEPAWPTDEGCVFELVALANEHGFYWGGHYDKRRDGMHFELSRI